MNENQDIESVEIGTELYVINHRLRGTQNIRKVVVIGETKTRWKIGRFIEGGEPALLSTVLNKKDLDVYGDKYCRDLYCTSIPQRYFDEQDRINETDEFHKWNDIFQADNRRSIVLTKSSKAVLEAIKANFNEDGTPKEV